MSFRPPQVSPSVSLDPRNLPEYAARSCLRMFLALACSTLLYGSLAAHNRRAERVLIPLLDILQSVPVLGFLSITVSGFIALFPGSLLGLEAASIFAIFTSQVWNMTFSFYQSLRTVPRELGEAATLYQLSRWHRFSRLELPSAAIPLLWNAMMSFAGGWFFLAASEAITVLNRHYTLPGIGSYVAAAIAARDARALAWAILTMAAVILLVDQLFWRPLVAWSDRFRLEQSGSGEPPRSWVVQLLRTARIPALAGAALAPAAEAVDRGLSLLLGKARDPRGPARRPPPGAARPRARVRQHRAHPSAEIRPQPALRFLPRHLGRLRADQRSRTPARHRRRLGPLRRTVRVRRRRRPAQPARVSIPPQPGGGVLLATAPPAGLA